jgi:hypothetical protein
MRFKIKVNYADTTQTHWWSEPDGSVPCESDATVYTPAQVIDKTKSSWFNEDRDAGRDCWLSLKLVP